MARILVVYHRKPQGEWRSTYQSNVESFRRFSGHQVWYLNTARTNTPAYLRRCHPDLVVFHYTFLAVRQAPQEFEIQLGRIEWIGRIPCSKAAIVHDEQSRSDAVCRVINDFHVTQVFSTASPAMWPLIYDGVDSGRVSFHTVLSGYVDTSVLRRIRRRSNAVDRPIDIGYRCGSTWPFYGRHGLMKRVVGPAVAQRAGSFGLSTDISNERRDLLFGDDWLDFLLRCKYVIGVEAGSSVFDRDGSIAGCTLEYLRAHDDPPFEDVEAACFPGLDGLFEYRLISARHIEAAMTRTCQVLVEGEYGGVLQAGLHYVELRADFSNLDEVLGALADDHLRARIVDRAYTDIVASGRYSYEGFVRLVVGQSLAHDARLTAPPFPSMLAAGCMWNRVDDWLWPVALRWGKWWTQVRGNLSAGARDGWEAVRASAGSADRALRAIPQRVVYSIVRPTLSRVCGERRLRRAVAMARRVVGRTRRHGSAE